MNGNTYANSTGMTVEQCQAYCASNATLQYALAGLDKGNNCRCGYALGYGSTLGQTGCNVACSGNSCETCGAANFLNVYNLTTAVIPINRPLIDGFGFQGCFVDNSSARILPKLNYNNASNMTNFFCIEVCVYLNYYWSGTEYRDECWCANTLATTATRADPTECNLQCSANNSEFCGASLRMSVYHNLSAPTKRDLSHVGKLRGRGFIPWNVLYDTPTVGGYGGGGNGTRVIHWEDIKEIDLGDARANGSIFGEHGHRYF